MNTKKHINQQGSLQQQIAFVLSKMPNTSADEITMEIMELKGVATEDGVAELSLEVEAELKKMLAKNEVKETAMGDTKRYLLKENN